MNENTKLQSGDILSEINRVQEQVETVRRQANSLSRACPSRELSLVITKLEEAELWFQRVPV